MLGMRLLRPHRSSLVLSSGPCELLVRGAKKATGHLFIVTQSPVLCRRPQLPPSCSGLVCRWSSCGFLIFCCCSRFLISLGAERWGWAGLCGSFLFAASVCCGAFLHLEERRARMESGCGRGGPFEPDGASHSLLR